jgi:superfamily I DNA/RNA helicase
MTTWSLDQNLIFEWFAGRNNGNRVVVARAGCGKTTTILEGVKRAPETRKFVGAFGNKIARELKIKLLGRDLGFGRAADKEADAEIQARFGIKVQTFHSLGCGYVMSRWPGSTIESDGSRAEGLAAAVCPSTVPSDILKLVAKLHTKGREIAPHAASGADLLALALQFECEADEQWATEFPVERICDYAARAMELAASQRPAAIDFADMIFLPVRLGWMRERFDLVVVDEAQDLTVAQLELAIGSLARGGRVCVVGDDRQAIYSFRGADSDSLARLRDELNAEVLSLKTTYRCGKRIVEMAAGIVPDFTAAPANPEGEIRSIAQGELLGACDYGDFILSRANAPLLPTAIALLRAGRRARIAGLDIGRGLKALIGKLARGAAANSVPAFIGRLGAWRDRELARAAEIKSEGARSSKIEFINDRHDMLLELSDGAVSVGAITAAIEALFTDDGLGAVGCVTLSSVHRAKGLEANRVFILADTLRTGSVEEDNIRYVAITRAKRELVMVYSEEN